MPSHFRVKTFSHAGNNLLDEINKPTLFTANKIIKILINSTFINDLLSEI